MRENPNRQVEFSGLSLAAAPPVGHLHLELRRGVTALYGQNGVGKSRILRAISDMLSGLAQRPGWDRNGEPAVNPTPPNAMQAAYQLGGLHIRVPLTPATVVDEAWHPAFMNELALYLEDDLQQDDRMETYPTELWAQLVYTVRTTLPWPDARDDEAEYLLRHGRWLLVPSGRELAFLCDPDSRRGLLAPRWEASDDLWRTAWRFPFGTRSLATGALNPPARLSWWQGANSGCWEVPEWPMASGHLSPRPFLPPTPELMGMPDWPEWAAFPVVEAPRAEHPPRVLVNPPVVEDNESAVERTVRRIATLRARPDGVWAPEEALARIGVDANAILRDLFVDPPELSGSLKGIRDWFKGDWPLEWTASVHGQPPIPVDRLGDAHRRFSSFAIQQATAPTFEQLRRDGSAFQRLSTAVIDEPERALHQLAIERLAGGLASIADYVLVASHASDVLALADHRYLVTVNQSGDTAIEQPTTILTSASLAEEARKYSMQPERLVASADVILLVEGQHDIEVLQAFLAPELARHLVLFVALGGTEGLSSIAESALLFGMTKVPIVICLDSLASSVGDDLRRLKGALGSSERYRLLAQFRARPEYKRQREMRALLALFKEAVAQERLDRLEVHGFAKPDIVRYLDVDLMTSKSGSWEDLEQQFLREMNQERFREGDGGKFKTWIGPAYQARGVRTAAMEQVRRWNEDLGVTAHRPSEFADLAALLDRLHPNRASGRHSDSLTE